MLIYIVSLRVDFHSCASMAIVDAIPCSLMYRIVERGNLAFHVPVAHFRPNTFLDATVSAIGSVSFGLPAVPPRSQRALSQHSC